MKRKNILWEDRKRNFLGLPWTFTKYLLDEKRLFIDTGFLNSKEDEVRLYRITDLTLTRSLWQKIIRTGTIHCDSADQTMRNFDIKNIKNPHDVKEQLSDLVEKARLEARVYAREDMHTGSHDMEHAMDSGYGHDMPDDPFDAHDPDHDLFDVDDNESR